MKKEKFLIDFYTFYDKNYENPDLEITKLLIDSIELVDGEIEITLGRPGLLIGPKGKNITDLQDFVKTPIKIVESTNNITNTIILLGRIARDERLSKWGIG